MAGAVGDGGGRRARGADPGERAAAPASDAPLRVEVLPSDDGFAAAAATRVAALLATSTGRVDLGLAGGSTPRPVYRELAATSGLAWDGVRLFFGDERRVPPEHRESNFRMVREALLDRLPRPPDAVHRMRGEAEDPDQEARRYGGLLPARIDLLLLGIGADGHTASLFPGSPALSASDRLVVAVESPDPPRGRYTVTPPVLEAAREIVVLARGREKAAAVARALEGPPSPRSCPARLARGGLWLLDAPAASRLTGLPSSAASSGETPLRDSAEAAVDRPSEAPLEES